MHRSHLQNLLSPSSVYMSITEAAVSSATHVVFYQYARHHISKTRNLEVDLPDTISNTSASFQCIFTAAVKGVQSELHQGENLPFRAFSIQSVGPLWQGSKAAGV